MRSAQLLVVNRQIFERFWEEVYSIKYIEDPDSPKYETLKALRLIEPLSIQVASQAELQNKLRTSGVTPNEIRRATGRLNQVLRFLKRDIRLNKPKAGIRTIQYLTLEEFEKVLIFLDGPVKDLAVVLFATGMRLGEALALQPDDYRNGEINITKQLDKKGVVKLPKAQKTGRSIVLDFGKEALLRWVASQKDLTMRYLIYDRLIAACRAAAPDKKDKWCSPHDLRHSHAIYLLTHGANLSQVSMQLRNRIDVCQMYYTGFAHTEGTLEYLKKILK